ncbi:MAG: ABC transporter permease subunit, partial [Methanomassiliicoccales archaeon]
MSELLVDFRKDLRQMKTETMGLIFITTIIVVSVYFSYDAVLDYVSSYHSLRTYSMMESDLNDCMWSYWDSMIFIDSLLLFILSASAFGNEKESGMLKFTLAYGAKKRDVFLSKFMFLVFLAAISLMTAMIMFVVMISASGSLALDTDAFLLSSLFVFMQFIIAISMGMVISALTKKKATAVILAILLMLGTYEADTIILENGYEEAVPDWTGESRTSDNFTNSNIASNFSATSKIVLFILPWAATSDGIKQSTHQNSEYPENADQFTLFSTGT